MDVDDNETVNADGQPKAISRSKAGTMVMFPPQFYILQRLSAFDAQRPRKAAAGLLWLRRA